MQKLKGIVFLQKLSLLASVFAVCLSIIAIISVNRIKLNTEHYDVHDKLFKPIKDLPDVEIIKVDGSVEKIRATESKDELGKLLDKKNDNKNEANIKRKEQEIIREVKNIDNRIKINDKVLEKKDEKGVQEKNLKKEVKAIKPVERNTSKVINISTPSVKQHTQEQVAVKSKIHGNFVVQIGAFKDKNIALKQCENVKAYLEGKSCDIATSNNQVYRAIIYPFDTRKDAEEYLNKFSLKTRIIGLIKKNA